MTLHGGNDGANDGGSHGLSHGLSHGVHDGAVRFGRFDHAVGPIRVGDYELRSPMGGFVSPVERDAAFRSFQFMGAVGPGLAAGCAVTATSTSSSAFAYLWNDSTFTQLRLGARDGDQVAFAADPDQGLTELQTARGTVRMHALAGGTKRLEVDSPDLTIDLEFADDTDVLRLCTPTGPTGWAYVQKVVAAPARGHARTELQQVDFAAVDALAHHDYTTGFLRDETWWHWACVAARLKDGRRFGLNVSCGTNESGYRENGGWLDGKWFSLGGAIFHFDPDDTEAPWEIIGTDDRFHLTFAAGHGYHANHESPAMATNFHQLFGSFSGWVLTDANERISLTSASGFTESQYLRW